MVALLGQLKTVGATDPVVTTPETDPVHLQGRPGQYTERATFALPGGDPSSDRAERGGVVEVFPSPDDAQRRSTFIQDSLKALPILGTTEYHYIHGGILVRVTGRVAPSVAERIGASVAAMP
jgi:hypothetical protein